MSRERRAIPLAGHGAHLIASDDGRSVVRMRTGRYAVLSAQPEGLEGALTRAPERAREDQRAYIERLSAELGARDAADDATRWPPHRRSVCLLGEGRVLDDLTIALDAWGIRTTRLGADEAPPRDATLVLAYADHGGERSRWTRFDELPGRGVAWLRVYREGECVLIDPLAVTAGDATSEQVSRRRVAASLVPDEVDAWQRNVADAGTPIDAAASALAVARVLQILLAWAQGSDALESFRRTLWKLVPATGTVTEHTVVAYPEAPRSVLA